MPQPTVARLPPKRGNKDCPKDCSGVGVCNYDSGLCYCPVGYGGPACSEPRLRPCFNMGSDKRDRGWNTSKTWTHSRCAGKSAVNTVLVSSKFKPSHMRDRAWNTSIS